MSRITKGILFKHRVWSAALFDAAHLSASEQYFSVVVLMNHFNVLICREKINRNVSRLPVVLSIRSVAI